MWHSRSILLYCIVLYCIVLYCIVLYCVVLCCVALPCIALHCIVSLHIPFQLCRSRKDLEMVVNFAGRKLTSLIFCFQKEASHFRLAPLRRTTRACILAGPRTL